MFFGAQAFALLALITRVLRMQEIFRRSSFLSFLHDIQKTSPDPLILSSSTSIIGFLASVVTFGLVVIYALVCEYQLVFRSISKPTFDPDQFSACLVVCFGFGLCYEGKKKTTTRPQPSFGQLERILEETKGILLLLFVLHRCSRHSDPNEILPERVFYAFYTWWTSFTHANYFQKTGDFGWNGILRSLWNPLSFLLVFGSSTHGGNWMRYFLCYIEVMALVVAYVVCRVGSPPLNSTNPIRRLQMSCCSMAIVFFLIWDMPTSHWFSWIVEIFLRGTGSDQGDHIHSTLLEWYVLSTQYHWYVLFGISFAVNWPNTLVWIERVDRECNLHLRNGFFSVLACTVSLSAISLASWKWLSISEVKREAPVPFDSSYMVAWTPLILMYIYLRLCTNWIRQHSVRFFELLGEHALEAYILHNHLVLCCDNRNLLSLLAPTWPKLNMIIVVTIFILATFLLSAATRAVKGMLFQDPVASSRNFAGISFFALSCLVLSTVLHVFNSVNVWFLMFLTIGIGMTIYLLIVRLTERSAVGICGHQDHLPALIGTLLVCAACIAWQSFHDKGVTLGCPALLPAECAQAVHQGIWFPLDACNEANQAFAFHQHGVISSGTCANSGPTAFTWGWQETNPRIDACRPTPRDVSTLLRRTLKHRNITFIGDSMIRHLYHATCRQVGHREAGAYNTSLGKWSDYSREYVPSTVLDFRWAPYTSQVIPLIQQLQAGSSMKRPDVLVVGCGAWDLLHFTRSASNRTALDLRIKQLAQELGSLQRLGQSIVWVEPTIINTWALTSDDKKTYMTEDHMTKTRKQYKEHGVLRAASFVLDGQAFSRDRVSESVDGVHYPLSVYDGGSQILLNALDWLLQPIKAQQRGPTVESLVNPNAGLVAMILIICIIFLDSFFGISYVSTLFLSGSTSLVDTQGHMKNKTSDHTHRAPEDQEMETLLNDKRMDTIGDI